MLDKNKFTKIYLNGFLFHLPFIFISCSGSSDSDSGFINEAGFCEHREAVYLRRISEKYGCTLDRELVACGPDSARYDLSDGFEALGKLTIKGPDNRCWVSGDGITFPNSEAWSVLKDHEDEHCGKYVQPGFGYTIFLQSCEERHIFCDEQGENCYQKYTPREPPPRD